MSTDIHFEIFVKKNRKAGWYLHQATPSRQDALDIAKRQLPTMPKGSVRVTKESFDEAQNSFLTVTIFEEGEERHKRQIRADNKMEPTCNSPDDLYSVHTRRTLGRALAPWLRQNNICALELLHRSDLAEKLAAAGHDRQHAIQKVAIAQAGAMECSVQHIVRRLGELADTATDHLRHAQKQNRTMDFHKRGYSATLAALKDYKEPVFALNSALASRMSGLKNWQEKISFLASCVSDALVEGDNGPIGLSALDAFLAEITALPHALDACAGGEELGDRLDRITNILCGDAPENASDSASMLAIAISSGKLPDTQIALTTRVFKDLRGPRRLYPDRFEDEVRLNLSLAHRLVKLPKALVLPEQLNEAFATRSSRLLEASSIELLLISAENPGAEILTLLEFEQSIVGEQNKSKLAAFLRAILGAHKTERWFCGGGNAVFKRLAICTAAQKKVLGSTFKEHDKHEISTALDRLCLEAINESKAFDQIESRTASPVQKAIVLLKLPEQGLVTMGKCAEEASRRAMLHLRTRGVRDAIKNDTTGQFQELNGLLQRAKAKAA